MDFDRILVTGGAGFVGSHTVDAILSEGALAWVLDDLSTGSLNNLRTWRNNRKFRFRRGSILQPKLVESLTRKVDAVIHLAALLTTDCSLNKSRAVNATNVTGTLNVLTAAAKENIGRLVFASSAAIYGNQVLLPITEDNPLHPISPYGASKLAGEKYCEAFAQTYGLGTIALRYFNVYGERQRVTPYSGVIAIFADTLRKGRIPTLHGDGIQTRDFIHVSDVVRANLQALKTDVGIGDAFNVGTGTPTTISQLLSVLTELTDKTTILPTHSAARAGDIRDSYASVSKATKTWGFRPTVKLKTGLKMMLGSIS